ncbi:flagellar basal body-associated FliL family protein [Cedecea neteri]|uniref:flagellar basal body-associated FliL family protein n=1 Tax=Cedecea neteri TaxID=158822 RepID=UPI0005D9D05E|nr:flagellar basal body-associated FliL family protein [Cedecea neteri]AJZ88540.1 flagellar biogenesis protein [Klebsiella michiganensis]WPU21863.1 flagellar basal body-associated FliL family protein [Cedecea neteri]
MTVKTFSLGLLIALIAAAFAAVLTIVGTHVLSRDEGGSGMLTSLFSSTDEQRVEFVEIKNVVITLQSNGSKERYLLLELALATNDPGSVQRINDMSPAVRGATVSLLSDMHYDRVRAMSVSELKAELMKAYGERFRSLNSTIPFQDVIISKMVFQ